MLGDTSVNISGFLSLQNSQMWAQLLLLDIQMLKTFSLRGFAP